MNSLLIKTRQAVTRDFNLSSKDYVNDVSTVLSDKIMSPQKNGQNSGK